MRQCIGFAVVALALGANGMAQESTRLRAGTSAADERLFLRNEALEQSSTGIVIRTQREEAAGAIELVPEKGRHTFHLLMDEQNLILEVLRTYGIDATTDASVKDQTVHFDTEDADFAESADLLKLATDTFFVPLDPLHVIVVADTADNRKKYDRQMMETIYFPGIGANTLNDMLNIVRGVFGIEQATVRPNEGTLTVRAPEGELAVLNQTYRELLGGRSEVQLDVRLYEIDKTRTTNAGVILPSSTTAFNVPSEINSILKNNSSLINQIISSGLASAGDYQAILAILIASGALTGTVFNSPFAVFGGGVTETGLDLNGVSANMLLNSSDVRSLDQLQLRVLDQEEAILRSGERYPILTSSYSTLASSSSKNSSTPTIPQVQYQDLGLTLKVQPQVEGESEVSLDLGLKLDSLAGATINNLPVLNHREYTGVVSLRAGESAIVVSAMSKNDSREIAGVPGLSDIPGLQDASNRQNMESSMELAIVITPHLVRLARGKTAGPRHMLPQH